ncbi:unnamed protein product [Triticum turgidum subsp. durum]|uniref:KIB1-4 beta-propeller domain-containing protein n=1 Tax=Triticum turgidum subsp. durum TaxID=4567 RepID=A0A9R1C5N5_TRITD|nr:unnamed protein product [Triticum turgidum subsp. durum]
MGRSKGAAARRKKAAAARKAIAPKVDADAPRHWPSLLPELLADIHDRLGFLDRIAFAAVFAASCDGDDYFRSAPWLLLPGKNEENPAAATVFSFADRCAATVRAPYPRDHLVLGSSRGWLATADDQGQIYLVNPATGEQHALPDITTMGVFLRTPYEGFILDIWRFMAIRFGLGPSFISDPSRRLVYGAHVLTADEMRTSFYRKVVLASPRRPGSHGTAMLILSPDFGAPAFATAEDAVWMLEPSHDGVEDAIHYNGWFLSVSYSGVVEAWQHDTESGGYTSTAVTPKLAIEEGGSPCHRKYLAIAPGGRLMVVLKYAQVTKGKDLYGRYRWTCSFKVHVIGDDGQWKETRDIGNLALFVGVNNSLCVPTSGRSDIKAGCIYFTDDEPRVAALGKPMDLWADESDARAVGVYRLKDGTVKKMEELRHHYRTLSAPPVWITPSIS